MSDDSLPFVTLSSRPRSRRPEDGNSLSSGDSAVRRDKQPARSAFSQDRSHLISSSFQYGSSLGDHERTPSATHDVSRVNYHVKRLPEFARTLEESAVRAFPNQRSSQRYKKVHVLLLHWSSDDLFVFPELEDLETCFRQDYNFETETFPIPSDNAHLDLMLKIGAMVKEQESTDTLIVVYYGGHARIDESRQSTWCATRSSDSPWLQWSAIQTLLERSLSDVLILLDCCAGAASATFPNGNSITETISASSWDAIAPNPGRYSFSNALIEVLQEWKRRTFSAAMLHAEVLARLKHPRPIMLNGKHFEARSTPVYFMMTANHKAPSIEFSRVSPAGTRPPSPSLDAYASESPAGRSAGLQDITGSEPNEDVPHVMISLALEDNQSLNINEWEHWLSTIPSLAKYVKVQGVFKSHSTLLLLSLPVMVWDLLPENHACNFIAFIRSNNLMTQHQVTPPVVEEQVPTAYMTDLPAAFNLSESLQPDLQNEIDADLRSIYSGTTAYTSAPIGQAGSVRFSTYSSVSGGKVPVDYGDAGRPIIEPSERNYRTPGSSQRKPHGDSRTSSGPSTRQHEAPAGAPHTSGPGDNSSRSSKRAYPGSVENMSGRPELPLHVQARLDDYYQNNPRPTVAVKEFLASNLGIETVDIDIWFYYRRQQQEVSNKLQSLNIDDHSHDAPKEDLQMILPGHLNKLLEIFPTGGIVMVDLRSPSEYERSHIHGAINFRAPATFVWRASMEMIEKALHDEASQSSFTKWYTSKCVVFYDKVVEYPWEAPTAEALYQKFRSKGWTGQCFVLKGHYREFSSSFDKYIIGANTTDSAKEYLASLRDISWDTNKDVHHRYEDWYKLIEKEDRVQTTELVPSVKDERMQAMLKQQRLMEKEFEKMQPDLYRQALNRRPDENWAIKAPMVAHLQRGLDRLRETGRSGTSPEDFDMLEDVDENAAAVTYEPGHQKIGSSSIANMSPSGNTGPERKGRSSGRGLFGKIMRSGRPDAPR
ncbi:hypothetical protein F5Y15DRAFT_256349 [Xylariaceae sp. FL0016]|nr:hypothetical protein F5Y15DRAFT_256349 [Xylariaceae sp. FL0016]